MKDAVLILNYNAGDALHACLRSLAASDASDLPVLVVDNGSDDPPVDAVECAFPSVAVHRTGANLGFAAGINVGLDLLNDADRVLVLNPDTVVRPDFYAPLSKAVDEGAAIAGSKLLLPGDPARIWCAGGDATFGLNLSRLRGHGEVDDGQHDRAEDVSFLPATVWLLDRTALDRIGPFDAAFFCYLEDLDYCVRAQRAGCTIAYVPRSVVVHVGSQASGGGYTPLRKYLNALGSWHLLRKHGTPMRWLRFLCLDVLTSPLAFGYAALQGRPSVALWKLRGLFDGWRGKPFEGAVRERLLGPRS